MIRDDGRHILGSLRPARKGFTLIELLVVILIILLVSAVTLPAVLPAWNHRQASEAARLLQGALVGARDKAIHDGQPSGIRLLPDPAFPIQYVPLNNPTTIDPSQILAFNRIVPIGSAPEYSDGRVSVFPLKVYSNQVTNLPAGINVLVLESAPLDANGNPNAPTNWFWNVRVGDKVQVNNTGPWYTVVGPAKIGPTSSTGNPEWFVNVGPPDSPSTLPPFTDPVFGLPLEFLLLTNGRDDGQMFGQGYTPTADGWIDSGFDGVDNDGIKGPDNPEEWENESWLSVFPSQGGVSLPYTIRRRPAPIAGAREISLPSSIVIDATSWNNPNPERSRLPIKSSGARLSGYVDILLNPDGTVVPTTIYGTPSSVGMDQAFYHFWLAERQDLATVDNNFLPNNLPSLPVPPGIAPAGRFPGNAQLKGQYAILTLFARTGQIVVNENPPFLFDSVKGFTNQPGPTAQYNASHPFIQAEQGVNGGP
jgi:prepilin-type N-terminal cleavage/methylation domain-containing protein